LGKQEVHAVWEKDEIEAFVFIAMVSVMLVAAVTWFLRLAI
jgi:transposase